MKQSSSRPSRSSIPDAGPHGFGSPGSGPHGSGPHGPDRKTAEPERGWLAIGLRCAPAVEAAARHERARLLKRLGQKEGFHEQTIRRMTVAAVYVAREAAACGLALERVHAAMASIEILMRIERISRARAIACKVGVLDGSLSTPAMIREIKALRDAAKGVPIGNGRDALRKGQGSGPPVRKGGRSRKPDPEGRQVSAGKGGSGLPVSSPIDPAEDRSIAIAMQLVAALSGGAYAGVHLRADPRSTSLQGKTAVPGKDFVPGKAPQRPGSDSLRGTLVTTTQPQAIPPVGLSPTGHLLMVDFEFETRTGQGVSLEPLGPGLTALDPVPKTRRHAAYLSPRMTRSHHAGQPIEDLVVRMVAATHAYDIVHFLIWEATVRPAGQRPV